MPPDTGPTTGSTALTHSRECTKKLPPLRRLSPSLTSSTPSHPVCTDIGDTHLTSDPLDTDALTSSRLPKRHRRPASTMPVPASVTTVPPSSGPVHGSTSLTSTDTNSYCTPDDVKSSPLPLTSSATCPAAASVLLHTTAVLLTSDARTTLPLKRHCRYPSPSDTAEKPLPCTVTDVPPSDAPRSGHTDDTASAAWYVNATPLALNC